MVINIKNLKPSEKILYLYSLGIKQGERVSVSKISQDLDINQVYVRRILHKLNEYKLITIIKQRGIYLIK